tara:strand:- start:307 stop:1188 length:882 start_codon:yes stop_codon:yes gene_type:complete
MANIKKTHIKNFKIKPPDKGAFTIETPEDIPKMHCMMMVSGKRGGGKSVATANFVRKLKDLALVDRCLLITPTYNSNKQIWDIADIADEDVYEPEINVLQDIIKLVEAEKTEWDLFLIQKEQYKQFKREIRKKPITEIDEELLLEYQEMGFFEGAPEWKYAKEVPPRLFLVIDDCMGTDLMKPRGRLINFCIKHRHIADGLGISVAMLVQSYCALGGVPRPIRENTTLLLLFKCKDENQRKKIHEEIGADVDLEKFDEMYTYATEEPFSFLLVDFNPKKPEKQFRKQFDEYLY